MITQKEFGDAFVAMAKGKMSPADFSKLAMEWFKSPDYNRWKAAHEAEELRRHRDGREYLMSLIELEKKAGTVIDYDIVPLRHGHDSVRVILNGHPIVCFPSYFGRECIDMNWSSVMDAKKQRACGNQDCGTSTAIDDETITFGRGKLDDFGYWEIPCVPCAEAFKKALPKYNVWPVGNAAE